MRSRLALAALLATGCATINERVMYRQAIDSFAPRVLKGDSTRVWITEDIRGGVSTAIAEEVFTNYILEKNLALIIEKHPDDLMGLKGAEAIPPLPGVKGSGESSVSVVNNVGGDGLGPLASGGSALGSFGAMASYDNNNSSDLPLEKEKKRTAQKILVWRVDELKSNKCVVHFRLSDASTGVVESSDTVTVEVEGRTSEGGSRPAGSPPPPARRRD